MCIEFSVGHILAQGNMFVSYMVFDKLLDSARQRLGWVHWPDEGEGVEDSTRFIAAWLAWMHRRAREPSILAENVRTR